MPRCLHCSQEIHGGIEGKFCCKGCALAFALIQDMDLGRFYQMVQETQNSIQPARSQRNDYRLFDSPLLQKEFVSEGTDPDGRRTAHFYLNNITCYACVWVCEAVAKKIDPETALSINLSTGESKLSFKGDSHALSEFMQSFEALGFNASPNREGPQAARGELLRVGASLFCLMNIMMLALPEYLDPESLSLGFRDLFRILSMILAGVSLTYCAWPMIKGTVAALRMRQLHLDLPIVIGFLASYAFSAWHTMAGMDGVYFDTTAGVIALLLSGRYLQKQTLLRLKREERRTFEGDFRFVRVLAADAGDSEQLTVVTSVKKGDRIRLMPFDVVAVKGTLMEANAAIDFGLLHGESQVRTVGCGEMIESGAVNRSGVIHLIAQQDGVESYLLQLQKAAVELQTGKGLALSLSEQFARIFVYFVLIASALCLVYWWPRDPATALSRSVAILLVACPCIFGFGAPLLIARAFQWGLARGVLFRSQRALEQLCEVKDFYFDKTGTLTEDESEVVDSQWDEANLARVGVRIPDVKALLQGLPRFSEHHVIRALGSWAKDGAAPGPAPLTRNFDLHVGQGISLEWAGHALRIGRPLFCLGASHAAARAPDTTLLTIDGRAVLSFGLSERQRPEAKGIISSLLRRGKSCWILSGDVQPKVTRLGHDLGLAPEQLAAGLSPEAKLAHLTRRTTLRSAFVGNGFNDALATAEAGIGIALHNGREALGEHVDIQLVRPGLKPFADAVQISRAARWAMIRCFAFAALFNLLGLGLAIAGLVTPVLAAILMPVSSMVIFALSQRWHPAFEE